MLPRVVLVNVEHTRPLTAAELSWAPTLLEGFAAGAMTWDAAAIMAALPTESQDKGNR